MSQVPWTDIDELLWLCCFQCTLDGAKEIQIHHIDGDSNNDDPDNWTVLCANCHSRAQSDLQVRTTMSIKYTPVRLKIARAIAIEACLSTRLGIAKSTSENQRLNEELGRPVDLLEAAQLAKKALKWVHSR